MAAGACGDESWPAGSGGRLGPGGDVGSEYSPDEPRRHHTLGGEPLQM